MQIRKSFYSTISGILLLTSLVFIFNPSYASDELSLNGIVKSVDIAHKTVTIDVKSLSCRGTWVFTIERPSAMEDFIGDRIDFSINSSLCIRNEMYSVISYRRVKR